jgi:GNAT superfamily N-acetyltransferase
VGVSEESMLVRARGRWADLAGAPVSFGDAGIEVVVSPESLLCPRGWVGIVVLGGAAISTAPDDNAARIVRNALTGLPATDWTDPGRLPVAELLGPATLAYCDEPSFRPTAPDGVAELPVNHADVAALLAAVSPEDAGECGLADITSPAFVLRDRADVVAAAGYQLWPGETAHVSVLTRPDRRGRGLARVVAGAAVSDALRSGRLAQWRARPEASRRVARALGFRELGGQVSVRLSLR